MRFFVTISILIFSQWGFADECKNYYAVPKAVQNSLGDLKNLPTDDVVAALNESFDWAISYFADVIYVDITPRNSENNSMVYFVDVGDDIWSAAGGSSYKVLVNPESGKAQIEFLSCWQSEE